MPQASDELRAQWPGGDEEAIAYLESRGFVLRRDWSWRPPTDRTTINERECSALQYLIDEWDFDGVISDETYKALEEMRMRYAKTKREWDFMINGMARPMLSNISIVDVEEIF